VALDPTLALVGAFGGGKAMLGMLGQGEPPPADPVLALIHGVELFHLVIVDIILIALVPEALGAGPAGWVGLALFSPLYTAAFGYTYLVGNEFLHESGILQ
jgi:hypothetical protein